MQTPVPSLLLNSFASVQSVPTSISFEGSVSKRLIKHSSHHHHHHHHQLELGSKTRTKKLRKMEIKKKRKAKKKWKKRLKTAQTSMTRKNNISPHNKHSLKNVPRSAAWFVLFISTFSLRSTSLISLSPIDLLLRDSIIRSTSLFKQTLSPQSRVHCLFQRYLHRLILSPSFPSLLYTMTHSPFSPYIVPLCCFTTRSLPIWSVQQSLNSALSSRKNYT